MTQKKKQVSHLDEVRELACRMLDLAKGKKMSILLDAVTMLQNAIYKAGLQDFLKKELK